LALVFCLAVLMAWEFKAWDRVERLRTAAILAAKEDTTDRTSRRITYQLARTRVIPDDPNAYMDLAYALFDYAIAVDNKLESEDAKTHVRDGLRAFRTARNLCPILPNPHFHFGLYRMQERKPGVKWFVSADPAVTYFDRAKALLPLDPESWYVAGVEAFERGDTDAAYRNWKQSLTYSPRQLKPILAKVRGKLRDKEILTQILPRDAIILMQAADALHPNVDTDRTARELFLEDAAKILKEKSNQSPAELEVLARVYEQKGDLKGALAAWYRAVDGDPDNLGTRARFAEWLEGEELYDDAVKQLEWLRDHSAGGLNIRDRIDMAKRGKDLRDAILTGR
jgi:tetratricopeptide (TPR) repeat protein